MAAKKFNLGTVYAAPEVTFGTDPSANGSTYLFVKALDATWQPSAEVIEREGLTGDLTRLAHTVGVKTGTLSFKLELKASGTPAASTVAAIAAESSPALLSCLGTVVRGTGSVTTSATTTSLTVAVPAGFAKYMLIEVDGQQRFITSIAGSVLTLDRALSGAPTNGTVVYASSLFKRANTGHTSMAFVVTRDDIQYTLLGCHVSCKLAGVNARGTALLEVTATAGDWEVTSKASLPASNIAGVVAVTPPVVKGSPFTVDGVEDVVTGLDVDFGATFVHQETTAAAQAKAGIELTDMKPGGAFRPYYSASHLTDFLAGSEKALGMTVGNRTNGFGIYVPKAQYMAPALEDRAGMVGEVINFAINDNGADPDFALGVF